MVKFLKDFKPSRREALKLGAAAFVTGLAMPAIAQSKPDTLVVSDGGGILRDAYTKAFYEPFTAKTGIKVSPQAFMGPAEIKAVVENKAWSQVDFSFVGSSDAAVLAHNGLLEPLDYGMINRDDFFDGTATDTWFMVQFVANCIAWNTERVSGNQVPKNWPEFFGTTGSITGARGLFKNAGLTLDIAAMGAGIPRDKLYPLDIDKALAALDQIKDDTIWWSSGAQSQELLASGQTDMSQMWSGRALALKLDGKPIEITYKDALLEGDSVSIPKGHPNSRWAQELAAIVADGANQALATSIVPYGPTTKSGADKVPADLLSQTASAPENIRETVLQDFTWWAEHGDKAIKAFTEWSVK